MRTKEQQKEYDKKRDATEERKAYKKAYREENKEKIAETKRLYRLKKNEEKSLALIEKRKAENL